MRNVKKYGWIGAGLCVGFVIISGLVPAQETEEIKELQITQADVELLNRIRQCRPADLSDVMDAVGLVGTGSMSPEMRPIRPGIKFAGFAYTFSFGLFLSIICWDLGKDEKDENN